MKKRMTYLCAFLLALLASIPSLASTGGEEASAIGRATLESDANAMIDLTVRIGGHEFMAKLYENESSAALIAQMPLTLAMRELNGNEKYCYFTKSLPANAEAVDGIHAGDLMLYGADCLVLFYQDFQTPYRYTKLGYIVNPEGLASALGAGEARVDFVLVQADNEEGAIKSDAKPPV